MVAPELPVTGDDFTGTFDDAPGAGDFRYRVELVSSGDQRLVVTSHFYVHAIAAEAGGCGCTAGGDLTGGMVPVLALVLPWLRRRRRARADRRRASRWADRDAAVVSS